MKALRVPVDKGKKRKEDQGAASGDAIQEPPRKRTPNAVKQAEPALPSSHKKRGAKMSPYTIPFVHYANPNHKAKDQLDIAGVSARAIGGEMCATRETRLVPRDNSRQFTIVSSRLSSCLSDCRHHL